MRLRGEDADQANVAAELRRAGVRFTSTLNGVRLSARVRAVAKTMGLERGVPDLLIFDPAPVNGQPTALELKVEAKRPKTDRAQRFSGCEPVQREYLAALAAAGWNARVGYGARDAIEKLRALGYPVGPREHERSCTCAAGEVSICPGCDRIVGWCKRNPSTSEHCTDCREARDL